LLNRPAAARLSSLRYSVRRLCSPNHPRMIARRHEHDLAPRRSTHVQRLRGLSVTVQCGDVGLAPVTGLQVQHQSSRHVAVDWRVAAAVVVRPEPGLAQHCDVLTCARVKWLVEANQLYALFAGNM
jgi:hypothetical protein